MEAKIPVINQDPEHILDQIELFALDMDGTVYLGEQWIDGAQQFLKKIESSGRKYVFLTNNSSKNSDAYVQKLNKMGLSVSKESIVTSGQATIYYLQKNFPEAKVFLLGNELLTHEFESAGIRLDEKDPDMVVTAFDTTLDYKKMCMVCDFVRAGLPYIATHPDYNCPTATGFIPDIGAIHAFINASSFRFPDRIIGKPYGDMMDYLLQRTGAARETAAMVGDRLYTDIAAGRNNGLYSILVLSGEADMEDVKKSDVLPHLIFDSVKNISEQL